MYIRNNSIFIKIYDVVRHCYCHMVWVFTAKVQVEIKNGLKVLERSFINVDGSRD